MCWQDLLSTAPTRPQSDASCCRTRCPGRCPQGGQPRRVVPCVLSTTGHAVGPTGARTPTARSPATETPSGPSTSGPGRTSGRSPRLARTRRSVSRNYEPCRVGRKTSEPGTQHVVGPRTRPPASWATREPGVAVAMPAHWQRCPRAPQTRWSLRREHQEAPKPRR